MRYIENIDISRYGAISIYRIVRKLGYRISRIYRYLAKVSVKRKLDEEEKEKWAVKWVEFELNHLLQ